MCYIECYQDLANAIIRQAIVDYKRAIKVLKKNPHSEKSEKVKEECEAFFNSDYYDLLTNVDSSYLINNIERVNKNAKKTIQQVH